jgi:hypothetical protein
MKRSLTTTAMVAALLLSATAIQSAAAQGTSQTIVQYSVDVTKVSNGYRASKIIGAKVYNDSKDEIGTIDDLIVNRDDRVPYATISVGGFLGVGEKLVVIPFADLKVGADGTMVMGGTKASLKELPKFAYTDK